MKSLSRLTRLTQELDKRKAGWLFCGGLAVTNLLVWTAQTTSLWPVKTAVFLGLVLLPGTALLAALRIETGVVEKVLYSFGLGVLTLMVSGLAANQLLPHVGIQRPLDAPGVLIAWNVLALLCAWAAGLRWRALRIPLSIRIPSGPTLTLLGAATLLPLLAAGGAFRLNNGGNALIAGAALCWAAGIILWLFARRNHLSDAVVAWCLIMLGLSILLMTALRSGDITGHDFPHEFRVYTLTHLHAHWDISLFRDPYNACLSITILPEVLGRLLHVSGLVIFKFVLQLFFAITPAVVYVLLRRFVSKLAALVGSILFISYPTFVNDAAMLTRQGVAYLFFSLALLSVIQASQPKLSKKLFLLCAAGVILSHYSTSYMFVAMFVLAFGCKMLLRFLPQKLRPAPDVRHIVSPGMVAVLLGMTFLWYSQITATARGLTATLNSSVKNIPRLLNDDNRSSDTSASLLLASRQSGLSVYQAYLTQTAGRKGADMLQYEPELVADDLAVTPLGKRLTGFGIHPSITTTARQAVAKLLQLLAGLSVVYAAYRYLKRKPGALPGDLVYLGLAGIIIMLSLVVLPTLSLNYGILRAFQQALIYLVIPLALFLTRVGQRLRPRLRLGVAAAAMTALFLLFTGFFAQLLGGVSATLTLNNHGLYYGLYYTTQADLRGYDWLKTHLPATASVWAASYTKAVMHDPHYPFHAVGVLPAQTPPGSYVFLDQSQIVAKKLYVYHEGSPLILSFPLDYYRQHTSQLYSTATTGVFQ